MADLNMMMRDQAITGLQTQIDAAVLEGDQAKVRKLTDDLSNLKAATAPKAPPYGDAEIRAALETKAAWFGIDPRKSGAAVRLGADMNPKKFATADAFADALIKAVDEEFKPAPAAGKTNDDNDGETDEERKAREAAEAAGDGEGEEEDDEPPSRKPRRSDGPGDLERGTRAPAKRGPWSKLADAPQAIAADIRRQADKMVSKNATKEQREGFITRALSAAYTRHQNTKGK